MKQRRTMAEAAGMIEKRQTSGMSVQAYCLAEGITPANYYYWLKRLRVKGNPESPKMIPVCIEKTFQCQGAVNDQLELTYPNGVRLSLPRGCEFNLIRELVFIL